MPTLTNASLHFDFDLNSGYWSLRPRQAAAPRLEFARLGAIYTVRPLVGTGSGDLVKYWDGELLDAQAETASGVESVHGPLSTLTVRAATSFHPTEPLTVKLTFALPAERPFLMWRVEVGNGGFTPLSLRVVDLVRVGPRFQPRSGRSSLAFRLRALVSGEPHEDAHPGGPAGAFVLSEGGPGRLAFFSNGYQSWSFAGALQAHMRQPSSIFGRLGDPKILNLVTPRFRRPGRFTSDMFGVVGDRDAGTAVVAGFLAQREQFSFVESKLDGEAPSLRLTAQCDDVILAPGETRVTDWAYLQFAELGQFDPLAEYAEAVARENNARVPAHTPVGWCSWYHYFERVTQADILSNLDAIEATRHRLPLDFIQIDDGFQAQVGDWFETKPTFPQGLAWLAAEIQAHGHTPGLWLAPYIVRSDARLLRQRPDWFLREPNGRLANAGFNWFRWCYGLDPTHPGVREHVRRLITTAVHEWGFPYLKLDFLFAAALPGQRYDPTLTRAQAMRLALEDIREAAGPDTFLLGCGCPLGSAVGIVDGMRISTDVAPDWNPHLFTPQLGPLLHREMDFVGVRNAIRNTINRAPLHRRWWLNDPDCLLVRDHDTRLTEPEIRSLASVIALSGGMFLVSDDMRRLSHERERYIASLLPVLGDSARAPNWMDSEMPDLFVLPLSGAIGRWVVAGVFNWSEAPVARELTRADLGLPEDGDYHVSEFWDRRYHFWPAGQALRLPLIRRHGVALLALHPAAPDAPALVATTFHFSQGAEVAQWVVDDCTLRLTVRLDRVAEGEMTLALPAPPREARTATGRAGWRTGADGLCRLSLAVNHEATLEVKW